MKPDTCSLSQPSFETGLSYKSALWPAMLVFGANPNDCCAVKIAVQTGPCPRPHVLLSAGLRVPRGRQRLVGSAGEENKRYDNSKLVSCSSLNRIARPNLARTSSVLVCLRLTACSLFRSAIRVNHVATAQGGFHNRYASINRAAGTHTSSMIKA